MSAVPFHTPYDGSHPLFKIGLEPLDPNEWIEVDNKFPANLKRKAELFDQRHSDVVVGEEKCLDSQKETLDLLIDYLPLRYPERYHLNGNHITISQSNLVDLSNGQSPLKLAAQLVQEDLVIMHKASDGWELASAVVCFPSSWRLREKFQKPLQQIHSPVPEFGPGSRNADVINRIFDNLQVGQPVIRFNWSISDDDELFHDDFAENELSKFDEGVSVENTYLRTERQTLTKLPGTKDIVFTIKINVEPLCRLAEFKDGAKIIAGLIAGVEQFTRDQAKYKAVHHTRSDLISMLKSFQQDISKRQTI